MLKEKFTTQDILVSQADNDADVLIIETAINQFNLTHVNVVAGENVDLLLLVTAQTPTEKFIYFLKPATEVFERLALTISNFPEELKMSCFGCFVSDENKVGVVFSSPKLMNTIGHYETTELYIDGTFDVSSSENAHQCTATGNTNKKARNGHPGDAGPLVEQRIIRQKRERKWVREAARRLSEEEDLLVPYNFREEEVYDFFGIRWMMEGNRGLDHPSDFWGLLGANNGSSSILDFYDNLARRKNLKRKCT
ncbi:hypothetical protein PV328_011763 [Microctonus aethiopoides]|uniref:Uncharacterized protein n=1 Tax=Microctonus aethiopoides TaxID=144406 RepID=A0AA39C3F3_9HYME|nr:hypothetical protein PV328_011763 [Microctonus aethiopoides]